LELLQVCEGRCPVQPALFRCVRNKVAGKVSFQSVPTFGFYLLPEAVLQAFATGRVLEVANLVFTPHGATGQQHGHGKRQDRQAMFHVGILQDDSWQTLGVGVRFVVRRLSRVSLHTEGVMPLWRQKPAEGTKLCAGIQKDILATHLCHGNLSAELAHAQEGGDEHFVITVRHQH